MRKIVSLFLCVLMTFSFALIAPMAVHAEETIPIAQFVADNHVLMTRADGRFIGWGDNTYGQLGLGASGAISYTKPIEITYFKDKGKIKQIAAIKDASFVLLNSGELYSCGSGTYGKLGQGDTYDKKTWGSVSSSLKFKKLYTNSAAEFVLAEDFSGSLYGWGKNTDGQLGVGDTNARTSPTLVKASANVKQLWLGTTYAEYIDIDNKLFYWGNVAAGQSGAGLVLTYGVTVNWEGGGSTYFANTKNFEMSNSPSPINVDTLTYPSTNGSYTSGYPYVLKSNNKSTQILYGARQTLGTVENGANHDLVLYNGLIYGWGDVSKKQLATNTQSSSPTLVTAVNTLISNQKTGGVNLAKVFVDRDSNYLTFDDGSVYVWGDNGYNKSGIAGGATSIDTPAKITALQDKKVIKVVAGRNTNYYITDAGDIYVSGSNVNGVTGLGDNYKDEATIDTPTKIDNLGFSETLEPPTAPLKITVPDKAEEEAKIDVAWDAVQGAAKYELKRTVTLRSGTTTSTASPAVVYDGDKTAYSDTAKPEWQTVAYELQAKNAIGDYSAPVTSNAVSITTKASGGSNKAPTITAIQNQILSKNGSATLSFTVNDVDDAETVLAVTASSNYTSLIPNDNSHLAVTGPDTNGNCTIKVTPQSNSVSDTPATITLTVQDPAKANATTSFTVAVNASGTSSNTGTTATTSSGVVIPPINITLKQPDAIVQTQPTKSATTTTYPELSTVTQTPATNTAQSSWMPTPAQLAALGLVTNTGNNNAPYVITIQPSAPQAVQQTTANNNNTALYVIVFVLIAVIVAIVAFSFASMIFNKNSGELHRIRFMLSEYLDSND